MGATGAQAQTALPAGGVVASGTATIATAPDSVTITQTTARAIVNWNSFNVASGNSVVFHQPDAGSATLNRVTGTMGSEISGQVRANGSVYLVNPNGIAITSTGNVSTGGGFVASTLAISDADFEAGRLNFTGSGASARVANGGTIDAGQGSYVALLGGSVGNSGTISVAYGRVDLASGESITLDLNGDGFMQVAVPITAVGGTALIDMAGTINASGGIVELRAATVRDAVRNVINLTGDINADSAIGNGGTIILHGGDGGSVNFAGTLSARATGTTGDGGFIETSGANISFTGLRVDTSAAGGMTGTWLIDPVDLTVDAGAAATISANLASNNVTLETTGSSAAGAGNQTPGAGDITIDSAVTWTSANSLTLRAYNNININAAIIGTNGGLALSAGNASPRMGLINATGTVDVGLFNLVNGGWSQNSAALPFFHATDFRFSFANASFRRVTGGDGTMNTPFTIEDVYGLQGIASANQLARQFVLTADIDASGTALWNNGAGFDPISLSAPVYFTGTFDGRSHVISGLTINRPTSDYVGLFSGIDSSATISNLTLTGLNITGRSLTAGLTGYMGSTNNRITNVHVAGTVAGVGSTAGNIGGLVGQQLRGTTSNSSSAVNVSGVARVGSLIGTVTGTVTNSWASGTARATGSGGGAFVGGLIGELTGGTVSNSYATGTATLASTGNNGSAGGLVGNVASNSLVNNSYATGRVSSNSINGNVGAGGLVGTLNASRIQNAYATGAVAGGQNVGGLVGNVIGASSSINGAYAAGEVSTSMVGYQVGGVVARLVAGSITNAYWDSYSTRQNNAFTTATGTASNVSAITSDPNQSGAATYAYKAGAYGNLAAAAGIGTATPTGFVFLAGNSTRPFLAFEVPTSFTTTTDAGGRLLISNSHQLQLIGYDQARLSGSYSLAGTIDLAETGSVVAGTPGSYSGMWSSAGFVPIGTDGLGNVWNGTGHALLASITSGTYGFTGTLDGNGFTLSNLRINRPTIKNIGLFGLSSGTLSNINVSGSISGQNGVGGLVGMLYNGGSVSGSSSAVTVTGNNLVGGLVGNQNDGSSITLSSASGAVSGVSNVGGLVGYASGATITRSFATGTVAGTNYVGGLIGYQYNSSTANSYATGQAGASVNTAGGLIGYLYGGSLTNSYSTGLVIGTRGAGGLIGQRTNGATVTSSYWNILASGQATSAGGTALTATQMQSPLSYAGWDFVTIWNAPVASASPALRP
ncbi:filamentous hemagglutinin N-terminal domain-containing protein [Sphingomonas sp. QA11]|uniref:beta strand repeat-containing protein n=1 Tax=Sphingomonas sp. QA11 TaxID=2950605 RepID=UPI0023490AB8|nr:GLUG motif-containing protein [Sphingomonas sp. QA11]WCM26666.1 filamentous hemagglutinin N-terminal domain-containing protein [Sphingomonas sp. QA11]